ncbi:hypothetical protein AAY473_010858 [Plecturocebus cupreus]
MDKMEFTEVKCDITGLVSVFQQYQDAMTEVKGVFEEWDEKEEEEKDAEASPLDRGLVRYPHPNDGGHREAIEPPVPVACGRYQEQPQAVGLQVELVRPFLSWSQSLHLDLMDQEPEPREESECSSLSSQV